MKRKRSVSVMLVAAMAATLFAGCGKNGGNDNGSTRGEALRMMVRSKNLPHSLQFRDPRSTMTMRFSRSSLRRPA